MAERAGVSVMTVSLALREDGARRMSSETRERVLQAVRDLDYQPNARARAFRLGRTNVIGLYAGHGYINVRSPFFTEIVSGLQEGCEAVRKDLLLHGVFHGTAPEDIYNELADGRIDGLIVTMPEYDPLGPRLLESKFPVVAVSDAHEGMPSITVDDRTGVREILDHLRAKGYRRADFLFSPAKPVSAMRRSDEFRHYGERLGFETRFATVSNDDDAETALDRVVARGADEGVTALVCWNDVLARTMLERAQARGLRVPEEIAITGFDGCPVPFADPFPLTTVVAPWAQAARAAVFRLDALLKGETAITEVMLPIQFRPGATT